jgi:RHS repeat-associated protein
MGRIGSLTWRHGHPVFDGDGDLDLSHDPAQPWRGFAYDGQGQLAREWIHDGQSGIADTTALVNHHLSEADVAAIGQASGAVAWDWVREPGVAGLVSIESPGQPSRWATTQARLPGHKLTEVAVDGVTHGIDHDDGGRMTAGAGWEGRYGPEDRLVTAWRTDTGEQEIYLYDALGRLTVILDGDGEVKEGFAHDGAHKVAAFDGEGSPKWEAVWGPGLNRLLEVRDPSGASPVTKVPLLDHRRSVVAVWDGAEERVTALASYDAKGRPTVLDPHGEATCEEAGTTTVCAGPAGLPFGWKGMWRSEVTGLVQMRARWYDPSLGEFTSPDPLLYIDSNNPYAYAAFDPVNRWDPSGLDSQSAARDRDEAGHVKAPAERSLRAGPMYASNELDEVEARPGLLQRMRDAVQNFKEERQRRVGDEVGKSLRGVHEKLVRGEREIPGGDDRTYYVDAEEFGQELGEGVTELTFEAAQITVETAATSGALGWFARLRLRGLLFERQALAAAGLRENKTAVTGRTSRGVVGRSVPDSLTGGITEVKDRRVVAYTRQLQIQADAALDRGVPFNLIVSPRTRHVTRNVEEAVDMTGGSIRVYNPETSTLTPWTRGGM